MKKSEVSNLKIHLLENVDPKIVGSLLFMPTSSGLNQIFRLLMNIHKSTDIAGKTIARQDTTQSQGIIYEAILASDNALI